MQLLDFQKEIIRETIPHSNLLIMASGMGSFSIIVAQLRIYDINNGITLVINASDIQKNILQAIDYKNCHFKEINKAEKRSEYYLLGGIFLCNRQTLLSDLINGVLSPEKISCIFVLNAEKISPNDQATFIIDIVKSKNEHCIIRGFTEDIGLNLEEIRTMLQVNKIHFYPRFHEHIQMDLKSDIDMMIKNLVMSKPMEEAQILLIESIKLLVKELKKEDKYGLEIDYDDMLNEVDNLYKEASLLYEKYFYKGLVRRYLNDIKTIKFLLNILFFDYQIFYNVYEIFWNEQIKLKDKSTWINLESAIMIMEKIGNDQNSAKKIKPNDEDCDYLTDVKESCKTMEFREGKMKVLLDLTNTKDNAIVLVRSDFAKEILQTVFEGSNGKIIVYTHREFQYANVLRDNVILFEQNLESIRAIELVNARYDKFNEIKGYPVVKEKKLTTIVDYITEKLPEETNTEKASLFEKSYKFEGFKGIYIINYKNSVEEQSYLVRLRSEAELYKDKINQYSKLPLIFFDTSIVIDETDKTEYTVQIDFREMRCHLPYFIYRSKAKIRISSLDIGDYIIGNVVIERKSIGDFINSINTGRLYTQTRNMVHYYKDVYILLEFVGRTCIADYVDNYIYHKLAIYLMSFPNVKIIWTNSELMSVKLMRMLHQNHLTEVEDKGIDPILMEILLNLPGIDLYNYRRIIDNFSNLLELLNSSKEKICAVLGKTTGHTLFEFLNKKINT